MMDVDINFSEMVWFVGVTVAINCLVFVVCGLLELVERKGLFQDAKIQKKVVAAAICTSMIIPCHLSSHFVHECSLSSVLSQA